MKKCLHLKKTKPHWRRKPAKVVTWRDRQQAERKARQLRHYLHNAHMLGEAAAIAVMAAALPAALTAKREEAR